MFSKVTIERGNREGDEGRGQQRARRRAQQSVTFDCPATERCHAAGYPIDWDTSSVATTVWLFSGPPQFDQPIGEWDTSSHHEHHGRRLPTKHLELGRGRCDQYGQHVRWRLPAQLPRAVVPVRLQRDHTKAVRPILALRLGAVSIK